MVANCCQPVGYPLTKPKIILDSGINECAIMTWIIPFGLTSWSLLSYKLLIKIMTFAFLDVFLYNQDKT